MQRLIVMLIVTVLTPSVFAQSLADVAKREKERRADLAKAPSQTITDVELRRAGGPATSSTVSTEPDSENGTSDDASSEASSSAESAAAPAEQDPTETREYWQDRLRTVDQRIASLEGELQSPEMTADPRGAARRQRLESQLTAARSQRQGIVDEGRRAGVPPGWLR